MATAHRVLIVAGTLSLLALVLRLGLVIALWDSAAPPYAYEHGVIAENLLAGHGFSITYLGVTGLTSQQAPLYPAALAALFWIFGTSGGLLVMQLLQCVAGAGIVLAVMWLCRLWFPRRPTVSYLAGAAAAVYPTHVYMVTHIQVVTWVTLALALLVATISATELFNRRFLTAGLGGGLIGLLLLLEPIMALVAPVAAVKLIFTARRAGIAPRTACLQAALMAGISLLMIAPWLARNYHVHGELVFIKSSFGYAFWQGNNPASWGTDKIPDPQRPLVLPSERHPAETAGLATRHQDLIAARHEMHYIDDVLLRPTGYTEFQGLSEPQRSRLLMARSWEFISAEPAQYARLCLQRLRYFLLFDDTNPKAADPLYRAGTVIWLVLTIVGFLSTRSSWRELWPTYAIFAAITLFHVLTISAVRFRIPLEVLTFVWPAVALAPLSIHVHHWLAARRPRSRTLPSAASPGGLQVDRAEPLHGPHIRLPRHAETQPSEAMPARHPWRKAG